jgi:hypothetical protein
MVVEARRLEVVDSVFGIEAAGRLLTEVLSPWMQDLSLLVESVESGRPAGALPDWQPGAVMALADAAMTVACAAAWSGYRPMTVVDQTMHFLRPVNFDVLADARIVRIGRTNSFGRATLVSAVDRRPVGMVSSAYAMV